jgi:hypothetical protein
MADSEGQAKAAVPSAVQRMTVQTVSELSEAFRAMRNAGQTWVGSSR